MFFVMTSKRVQYISFALLSLKVSVLVLVFICLGF